MTHSFNAAYFLKWILLTLDFLTRFFHRILLVTKSYFLHRILLVDFHGVFVVSVGTSCHLACESRCLGILPGYGWQLPRGRLTQRHQRGNQRGTVRPWKKWCFFRFQPQTTRLVSGFKWFFPLFGNNDPIWLAFVQMGWRLPASKGKWPLIGILTGLLSPQCETRPSLNVNVKLSRKLLVLVGTVVGAQFGSIQGGIVLTL